ncbi:hypothetical protein NNG64_08350 [Bacillus siamensis]|uniref:Uncharacterized protein n=1 Tax=Bacillus siamensis TaxID=659243 RepID=A0AAI8N0E6_9BACI|nr:MULTISPECIES: hypothetical protein [Bacillus]AME05127.1 hypothetical protein AUL54_01695 [Bacillus sp. SDLI1]AUJ77501.1 hypothetical protein CWD84_12115 [Bacillus siamensis]UUA85793.1 hypothetical protein NNG64_08350 [Bacillus siamensis]
MKKWWICIAVFLLCFCGVHSAEAATTGFGSKTSFIMEGDVKEFFIENPGAVSADDYLLGYKFTIVNNSSCNLNVKLQRMALNGNFYTLSSKSYSGSWLNLSAQDKKSIDSYHKYRILIESSSNVCASVHIKGLYGVEYYHFD